MNTHTVTPADGVSANNSVAVPMRGEMEIPAALNMARDQVRWAPIAAGLLFAITTMMLLNLLGIALGLSSLNAAGAAQGGVSGAEAANAGTTAAIWAGVVGIVAFFVGGYVAGKTSAVFSRGSGALNGALVFLLAVPLTLWLASVGVGALLGSLGNFAGALNVDTGQIQNAVQGALGQARGAAEGVSQSEAVRAAQAAKASCQTAAWGALIGSLLGLGAAAMGGAVGTRRHMDADDLTGHAVR